MKTFIALILGLLISSTAFADYAVKKNDGSVVIIDENVTNDLETALKNQGLDGLPIIKINSSLLPPIEDRKYWKFNFFGNKIVVDEAQKRRDLDAKQDGENQNQNNFIKIGLTREEFRKMVRSVVREE